ncbi:hypothetical protein VTJ04DRAFT_3078 [Mycothermus thermophilus]|uniref:uncharacterized protein n=1 Tax=Humicola insolens TaxID=85995 RepID=UPI003742BFCA
MLEGLGFFWYSISTTPRATKYYGSAPGEARLCCLQRCRLSSGSPRCLAAASPFFNHNFVTRDLPSILNLSISITSLGPFCSRVASIVPSALGPASRRTSLTPAKFSRCLNHNHLKPPPASSLHVPDFHLQGRTSP